MTYHLTLTAPSLQQVIQRTMAAPLWGFNYPAGISRLPDALDFLLTEPGSQPVSHRPFVTVVGLNTSREEAFRTVLHARRLRRSSQETGVLLALGHGAAAGYLAGVCFDSGELKPLATVRILSSGLLRIPLEPQFPSGVAASSSTLAEHQRQEPSSNARLDQALWSRTVGALGEESWEQICSLETVIIGCGRTGSLAASALRRLGVHRLTLVDPDRMELHNLGEMDAVTLADLGHPKVEAVGSHLQDLPSGTRTGLPRGAQAPDHARLTLIPEPVLSLRSLVAAKEADLLVSCVDNGTARLAAAVLAKLYLKPLLDVGAGIFHSDSADRQMGADIRLVLPDRCLLCFGGIAQLDRALEALLASPMTPSPALPLWHDERAGSLRSLNQVGTGLMLRLLEDFISGRLQSSTWIHAEFNPEGIPGVENRVPPAAVSCRLCALTAQGDDGLRELPSFLATLRRA